ncbi:hypothetical protein [Paenibacillus sacheonensis]|uniref:Uncharacterized protein n=1 Tax=Paenibacillus sacheonensis TaxID=742054 RepID=A0A7X4YRX3_9BACL|nr:hypothetical protein [Paenibacillus sacheonensis]MBM7567530.1 hypothetical protein [Paenibacillus sacheonensis]NBC71365.1 hypothetical protein [Paenibacillus sacheonensis]
MRTKQEFVVVVIPMSEIRKFVVIDIVGGTALYYMLLVPLHSVIAAMTGSMIGPLLIRRSLRKRPR